jgi:hypothetical protein
MVNLLTSARWAPSDLTFLAVAVAVAIAIPPAGTVGLPQIRRPLNFCSVNHYVGAIRGTRRNFGVTRRPIWKVGMISAELSPW